MATFPNSPAPLQDPDAGPLGRRLTGPAGLGKIAVRVCPSVVFLTMVRVFGWLVPLGRSPSENAEIMVPRHDVIVLCG